MDPAGNFASALSLDLTTQFFKLTVGIFRLDGALGLFLRFLMRGESSAPRGSTLARLCVGSPIDFVATRFHNPAMTTVVVVRSRSVAPAVGAGVRRIITPLRRVEALVRTPLMRIAMIACCVTALTRSPLMRIAMIARCVSALTRASLMRVAMIAHRITAPIRAPLMRIAMIARRVTAPIRALLSGVSMLVRDVTAAVRATIRERGAGVLGPGFQLSIDLLAMLLMFPNQLVNVRLTYLMHLCAVTAQRLDMALAQMIHEPLDLLGPLDTTPLHRQVMQTHETCVPMAKKSFRLENLVVRRALVNAIFGRCPGRLIGLRRGAQAQRRPQHGRGKQNKLRDPHPQSLRSSRLHSTIRRAAPACIRRRVLGRAIFARPRRTCITSESGPSESRRFRRRS